MITYSIIAFLMIPIFGLNFIISVISNVFLLLILVPIFLFIVALLTFNSIKTKSKTCTNCGLTTFGDNEKCLYCGIEFNTNFKDIKSTQDASREVIEIDAEEIK